ncbi:hypothetical protein GCM10027613_33170 [Microlunatus endophyticus]
MALAKLQANNQIITRMLQFIRTGNPKNRPTGMPLLIECLLAHPHCPPALPLAPRYDSAPASRLDRSHSSTPAM